MSLHLIGSVSFNLLVLVGLTYLLSRLEAARPDFRRAYAGAAFGIAAGGIAVILMLASFYSSRGLLIDLRSVVLLMAGTLGGPVAAIVATAIATAARLAIGGANYPLLALGMGTFLVLGVGAWAVGAGNSFRSLLALGLILAALRPAVVAMAGWLGWLDPAVARAFLTETFPPTALFYPAGVVIMGSLLRFEFSRAGKTAGLQSENRELALRDARYRAIFETSSVAMMWMEKDGHIIRVNQRMADFVGYPVRELESMHYEDLLAPDDREDYFRVRAEQEATGLPPKDCERRYLRKDGGFAWGLRSTALVQPSADEPLRKFVIIQDVTDRKRADQKIRLQAELLESVGEAVIATDMQGSISFWNRFAEKLCGWPAESVIGRNIVAVLPSIKGQFELPEVRARIEAGETWSGDVVLERPDGSKVLIHAASSPVTDVNGTPVGTITVASDITEATRQQLALLEEQRTLAILNRTAAKLNAERDLKALMQAVTDAGVELTGAEFGALRSSSKGPSDSGYALHTLSGIDPEAFEALPLPRDRMVLGKILGNDRAVRCDDITTDARFAAAIAAGECGAAASTVRSYLATPLVARSGEMIGALIFGHSTPSMFNERSERIVEGIASHAAIAIEKASLFNAAQQEIETRKAAEESLSRSKARFRDFAEVGSDLLWETDERLRITSIVGDSRAVFGMPEEELIGRTAWEIAKADIRSPDWKQHVLDHETRQPFRNFEYPIADRNGATRWISTNGRPYFDDHGVFLGFRGASMNIAGRKHAEAKLAASARQQQSAAVLSQLALQGVPREDLYQVAVDLVAQTLGVELVGILELSADKRVLRLRAGAGWPSQSVNIRAVPVDYCPPLARGISSDVPVHFSRRNFNLIPGLQNDKGSGVALPIGEKAMRIGVIVVCSGGFRAFSETDINFLRAISFVLAADAEQRKSAATLRLRDRALESIGEGIMITDAAEFDNPITYVNPAFERLTSYSKDEAIGRNARFLQGTDTDGSLVQTIRGAVENETMFRGSILNYRKDGEPFWNNLTVTPIRDESGATSHFVGVLSDETERVQMASQLRQAQKMEALGHLTGGVAHDFNNLLAVILGNSEILYEEISDPELKTTAELVMTTAEKGADLTQRLLAFGRRQALHPEPLDLGATIGSLSDMLHRTLGSHITLKIGSTADKPAYVDRGLFESAILNLVLNARDAMSSGGVLSIDTTVVETPQERVKDLPPGAYVCLSVKDTGVGMAKDVLDRAFDPFFTTKGVGKGSGMGLSMVYGFAKQSGGHVTIESRVGRGTTVYLYLPVAQDSQQAKRVETRDDEPTAGGSERILLVEDEPHVRRFVSSQLAGLGYSVVEAEAGAPALEILRSQEKIDLLFTDLLMPGGMSGFDLAQRAREFAPDLKVLLTTGYAAEADALLADVKDPILKKPYKKQQLAEALRNVLEQAA
jgi:PAS domain S-box-containing protein